MSTWLTIRSGYFFRRVKGSGPAHIEEGTPTIGEKVLVLDLGKEDHGQLPHIAVSLSGKVYLVPEKALPVGSVFELDNGNCYLLEELAGVLFASAYVPKKGTKIKRVELAGNVVKVTATRA